MSLISIAFGLGTPLALFAALLHMSMHSLSKTAAFFSCGNVMQRAGTQTLSKLRDLSGQMPVSAALLLISTFAILGLPPSGLFISELLLILAAFKANIGLTILLLLGLGLAFLAILLKMQPLFWSKSAHVSIMPLKNRHHAYWPAALHLVIVIIAGVFVPFYLLSPIVNYIAGVLS